MSEEDRKRFLVNVARLEAGLNALEAAEPVPEVIPRGTGAARLTDMEYTEPGAPLVDDFLTPDGVTIVYGHGNVGKGWLSLYFAGRMTSETREDGPLEVGILDFEGNKPEWMSRARRLGLSEAQMDRITYASPSEDEWTATKGWIWEAEDEIKYDFAHCDFLIIDSLSAATPGGEAMGGKEDATRFFRSIERIGIKGVLALAHVGKQSEKFPKYPFGSANLRNQCREAWAVEPADQDFAIWADIPEENRMLPEYFDYEPDVLALELRCTKRNAGQAPDPKFITFSFDASGGVGTFFPEPPAVTLADKARDVLAIHDTMMTIQQLVKAMNDKYDGVKAESLKVVLNRNKRKFVSYAYNSRIYWGRSEWGNSRNSKVEK